MSEEKYYADREDKELRQLALDLSEGKVFTDRHIPESDQGSISSVFMPIALGAFYPKPVSAKYTEDGESYPVIRTERVAGVDHMVLEIDDQTERTVARGQLLVHYEQPPVEEIGMVYEYLDKAGPLAINGMPSFFSMRILNREDAAKVLNMWADLQESKQQFLEKE